MGPEEMRFEEMRFSQKVHAERRKKQGLLVLWKEISQF